MKYEKQLLPRLLSLLSSEKRRFAPTICYFCALSAAACIRAPDVVMVDHKTVLEEQASGELLPLENELREAALTPKGVDFTRAQLQEAGTDLSQDALSTIVQIHGLLRSEAELLDELLVRRCIGESLSGLLVETPQTCAGRPDSARITSSIERVNRGRRQLWHYLQDLSYGAPLEEVRQTWRQHHIASVICGGQIEVAPRKWEKKPC